MIGSRARSLLAKYGIYLGRNAIEQFHMPIYRSTAQMFIDDIYDTHLQTITTATEITHIDSGVLRATILHDIYRP